MNTKSEKAILYVGALHDHVTESMLFKRFRPAGPIRFIQICRDNKTVPSLIHAYVSFKYRADAERAMVKLNYECLMGQPMRIMWAQRHLTRGSTCVGNLFIENVDKSIDSMGLFELFPISKKDEGYEEEPKGYSFLHF
ncbi:polyadenylate-binding protein 1-like 2 [Clarias gariepinus]